MSAKGHVMYYSNASNTGEVPTADCISMNSKKGEVGGSREDISVARPESEKEKKKNKRHRMWAEERTDLKRCFNTKDMHHSIKIHTLHSARNYDALSGGAPLSAPIHRCWVCSGSFSFLHFFFFCASTRQACGSICMYYALFPDSDGCWKMFMHCLLS